MKLVKNQTGFSLIEVMASVAVISFAMVGIFSLLVFNQKIYLNSKNRFVATMLSQEGAELVRNVRDSNWLNSLNFNDGLAGGTYAIDAAGTIKDSITSVSGISDTDAQLKLFAGSYQHGSGAATPFARIITVENVDEPGAGEAIDAIKITSLVQWQEYSNTRQHETVVFLYDWR